MTTHNTTTPASETKRAEMRDKARYYFGYTFAGLDDYLRGYGHIIGAYIDGYNIESHFDGLCEYIARETETPLNEINAVLSYIFFYKY